ncbi:MAG: hypothetical protein ABIS07_11520 [Dokdonella sp.]
MLEGFEPPQFISAPRTGRPPRAASSHLRNLAWLRFLLRSLDDVERWALAWKERTGDDAPLDSMEVPSIAAPAAIPSTWYRCHADADLLSAFFSDPHRTPMPSDVLARNPALLDDVFGRLFAGVDAGGGRYFSDRIVRGLVSPDVTRLQRLDDISPGSRGTFEHEPAGIDPWFYDALDFTSLWFAKLYLWRVEDPGLVDPGWDPYLAEPPAWPAMPLLAPGIRETKYAPHAPTDRDIDRFERLIANAVAMTAHPYLAESPSHEVEEAVARLHAAAAAPSSSPTTVPHPVAVSVGRMDQVGRWAALSNAVAGCRLARMADIDPSFAAWWLRGVCDAMLADIQAVDRELYCPMPKGRPALETVLNLLSGPLCP